MNKTVNINLAGLFFHIDEDAYLKLSRYLEAIKRSFTDSQGRSEIISDIEARIAELFTERIENEKHVVSTTLVDEIITIMGQPEDYLVDDDIFEDTSKTYQDQAYKKEPSKKLYRDTDNSFIGGVASGLGHYLGIDSIWVRLLWLLFAFFSGGTFVVIYIIFWALVPEAKTTAQKLTMTGEPVTISNIEKKIKDGIDAVSDRVKNVDLKKHGETLKEGFEQVSDSISEAVDNISDSVKQVDFEKKSSSLKKTSQSFFGAIGNIIKFFLKLFAKFFGVLLIIIGISTLIGLMIGFFTVGITNMVHLPGVDFIETANVASIPIWLMSLTVFFALSIPFFFVFYTGLKIVINNLKPIGNPAKFTLLGLWIVSLVTLFSFGIRQASEFSYDAYDTSEATLNITTKDTLRITMVNNASISNKPYVDTGDVKIFRIENNQKIIANKNVIFIVRSTKEEKARIELTKYAYANDYDKALDKAVGINYNYVLENNVLKLDKYLTTSTNNKFSKQRVQLVLYLPEGTTLYADKNTYRYHRNRPSLNDILDNGMEEEYLKIIEDDVECLSCDNSTNQETEIEAAESKANLNNKEPEKHKTDSIKRSSSIKVDIDENGINISTQGD